MRPALLLIDLQNDFLGRPGLYPPVSELTAAVETLLNGCRDRGIPVLHAHTLVSEDGSDRMPHWKRNDILACVRNSPGALPPRALTPGEDEAVVEKRFYSAFGSPDLQEELARLDIDTLIIAGIYLHGCVRATALDAYERGYEVWVADDAVGSTEVLHAEVTRAYLDGRAATFLRTDTILGRLDRTTSRQMAGECTVPSTCTGNQWQSAYNDRCLQHRNPSDQRQVMAEVPLCGRDEAHAAVEDAARAWRTWRRFSIAQRTAVLDAWGSRLEARAGELTTLLTVEIGKPLVEARDEVTRALAHLRSAAGLIAGGTTLRPAAGVHVKHEAVGVIGIITPWNNPVAIPVGKLAPALAFGNAVVWKPSPRAPRSAMLVMDALIEAGLPPGVANLIFGDAETARHIISDPGVSAVSLTGSISTGQAAAALCTLHAKPLQAELGGNNAAIILADCDLESEVDSLARAAFSYAGQRCTATRRFIVETSIAEEFTQHLAAAVANLRVGDPGSADTQVGPLISAGHLARVQQVITDAVAEGAELIHGGDLPRNLEAGCWLTPALLRGVDPESTVVQEETFGPLAVILEADDLDTAIALANDVPHGLVASVHTRGAEARARVSELAEAGVVKLTSGPLQVHPDAPFGGWKASGMGPPEHGLYDREFYSRPRAIYGAAEADDGINAE